MFLDCSSSQFLFLSAVQQRENLLPWAYSSRGYGISAVLRTSPQCSSRCWTAQLLLWHLRLEWRTDSSILCDAAHHRRFWRCEFMGAGLDLKTLTTQHQRLNCFVPYHSVLPLKKLVVSTVNLSLQIITCRCWWNLWSQVKHQEPNSSWRNCFMCLELSIIFLWG